LHVVTPIVTVLVWLVAGPRGLINIRVILLAMVLPLLWAAAALIRGAAIGAYPYPFLDVSTNGLPSVLAFIAAILVVALILGFALLGLDALFRRMSAGFRARG
jgi:apolipoprotein N-acyltransferase